MFTASSAVPSKITYPEPPSHTPQHHRNRRHQLKNTIKELCSAASASEIKQEARMIAEDGHTNLHRETPDLVQVGARFDNGSGIYDNAHLTKGRGSRNTDKAPSSHMAVPHAYELVSPSTRTRRSRVWMTPAGGLEGNNTSHNNSALHVPRGAYNHQFIYPGGFNGWSDSFFDGQAGHHHSIAVATPDTSQQQHIQEYPDLFYAHNPQRYAAYKQECSRYYEENFAKFMRRSLQKHECHLEQEGIERPAWESAMKVPPPRGEMTETKKREWYLSARQSLFGTSQEDPIPDCENSGTHSLRMGKRTYPKRYPCSRHSVQLTPGASVTLPTPSTVNTNSLPSVDSNLPTNPNLANSYTNYSGHLQQPLGEPNPLPAPSDQVNMNGLSLSTSNSVQTPCITVSNATQPPYDDTQEMINNISPNLSEVLRYILNNALPEESQQLLTEFRTVVEKITRMVNNEQTRVGGLLTPLAFQYGPSPPMFPDTGRSALSISNSSHDLQLILQGSMYTPSHSGETSDDAIDSQTNGYEWLNQNAADDPYSQM